MEHRITIKESGVISVYIDINAAIKYMSGLLRDGVAFSYELA